MKKLNYLLLGAVGLLMASCANDDLESLAPKGDGNVNITVKLPGTPGTRAVNYGDGLQAQILKYAVYEQGTDKFVLQSQTTFPTNSLETTVSLNLVTGKNYNIAFFALSDAATGVYTFNANPDEGNPSIDINYSAMTSAGNMADDYDCFYAFKELGEVNANINMDVDLIRPVAQINWGTDDLDEDAIKDQGAFGTNGQYIRTNLTIDAYTTFSLLDNDVVKDETQPVEVVIKDLAAPVNEAFPVYIPETVTDPTTGEQTEVNSLKYVAMQFVLAPKDVALFDLNLDINNSANKNVQEVTNDVVTVHSAPLQANYRTNIYGSLLTNPNEFTVVKDPNWNKPDYEVDATVWNGTTVTTPVKNSAGQYAIYRASDLAGLAQMVSEGNSFEGETVILSTDFDLGGNSLQIGKAKRSSSTVTGTPFQGTFDGNGHSISNLTITAPEEDSDCVGFIANLDGDGVLQNVVFNNVQITDKTADQAGIVSVVTNGAKVSNVNVMSGNITSYEAAGGIVGRIISSGTVENCNNYATITAEHYHAAGIVGAAYYGEEGKTMTVNKCNNYGTIVCNGETKDWGMETAAGIVGYSSAYVTNCVNEGEIQSGVSPTGGIVGWQTKMGAISGCTNKGNVSGGCLVGGIAGLVDTTTEGGITVSNNTNTGNVTGIGRYGSQNGGVGGIIGSCGSPIYCYGNTNSAQTLNGQGSQTTGNYVAGILGQANTASQATTGPYVKDNVNNTPLDNMYGNPKADLYNGATLPYTGN